MQTNSIDWHSPSKRDTNLDVDPDKVDPDTVDPEYFGHDEDKFEDPNSGVGENEVSIVLHQVMPKFLAMNKQQQDEFIAKIYKARRKSASDLADKFYKASGQALKEYKFRAECELDVKQFLHSAKKAGIQIVDLKMDNTPLIDKSGKEIRIPDVDVIFKSDAMLGTIKHILRLVPDGHVMYETVQQLSDYTGNRDYKTPPKLD